MEKCVVGTLPYQFLFSFYKDNQFPKYITTFHKKYFMIFPFGNL